VVATSIVVSASATDFSNLVSVAGGSLFVTNTTTLGGQLIVGQNGAGTLALSSGSIFVNQLLVTNNTATATNSFFNFNGGTLTTSNALGQIASKILLYKDNGLTINSGSTWNMLGGSNQIIGTVAPTDPSSSGQSR